MAENDDMGPGEDHELKPHHVVRGEKGSTGPEDSKGSVSSPEEGGTDEAPVDGELDAEEELLAAAEQIVQEVADDEQAGGSAAQAQEHLADLQRLQAEFVNYRKRVERDRNVARDNAVIQVMEGLIPVLDDIDLARQHGDLEEGPFAAIATKLEGILGRFKLERYADTDVAFDPQIHEALMQQPTPGVERESVSQVLRPGYRVGERILRAAQVIVAVPE